MQQNTPTIHLRFHQTTIFDFEDYTLDAILIDLNKKSLVDAKFDDYINTLPAHLQAYFFPLKKNKVDQFMLQLFELTNSNGKGEDFIKNEFLKYLQKHFFIIAQKQQLKVYVKQGKSIIGSTNKSYHLQPQLVQLKCTLTLIDEVYGVDFSFQLGNEWVKSNDCNRQQFMIYHNNNIYLLSYTDCVLLNEMEYAQKTRKIKSYYLFNEKYLTKIEVKHAVDRSQVFAPIVVNSKLCCKVHVKETLGTYLIIEPVVYYDEFAFSNMHTNKVSEVTIVKNGVTYTIVRQVDDEKAFYNYVQSFHENFKKQLNGYFQLNFGEAGKKHWFYKFYSALIEQQIDLIGIDFLQHFRYSAEKPVTAITIIVEEYNKFTLDFVLSYGKEIIPLPYLQKALRNGQHSFPLKDNSIAVLPPEWLQQYATMVKHGTIEGKYLVVSKSFVVAQQLQPNHISAIEQNVIPDDWQKNWLAWQQKESGHLISLSVNATLRDYQQKGTEWLYLLAQIGAGALLADDMGLGKTLQTIAYLQYYNTLHPEAKHLVIAPASLLYNWQKEIEKFAPNLKVTIYYGAHRNWTLTQQEDAQVILTTYSIGRNDIEQLQSYNWSTIILDESHNIKNPHAQTTIAITQLNAGFKICLSGTPVMNNTMDLYAQFNFLLPGFFYSRNFFKQEYAIPIDDEKDEEKLAILQKLTNPYILRRTKQQVAKELPPKTESIIWCTLTDAQRTLYEDIKEENWTSLQTNIAAEGIQKSRLQILTTLLRLRQACDSPLLLPEELQTTTESAKLQIIIDEIKNNTGDSKVVVFTQFVKMMDLLSEAFEDNNISYQKFDGSTNAKERADLVNQFQSNEDSTKVFLISLKAGAVGITLTQAEYVFLVDPWWNKAIENQAIDRIHRIGQTKHIFAYKMICKNTIEERIIQLQERKHYLSESLIQIEEDFVKQLSEEDLAFLFS
jgi:superfamily II DNA or RNA helicase